MEEKAVVFGRIYMKNSTKNLGSKYNKGKKRDKREEVVLAVNSTAYISQYVVCVLCIH